MPPHWCFGDCPPEEHRSFRSLFDSVFVASVSISFIWVFMILFFPSLRWMLCECPVSSLSLHPCTHLNASSKTLAWFLIASEWKGIVHQGIWFVRNLWLKPFDITVTTRFWSFLSVVATRTSLKLIWRSSSKRISTQFVTLTGFFSSKISSLMLLFIDHDAPNWKVITIIRLLRVRPCKFPLCFILFVSHNKLWFPNQKSPYVAYCLCFS